jgi:hypothetical protein
MLLDPFKEASLLSQCREASFNQFLGAKVLKKERLIWKQ